MKILYLHGLLEQPCGVRIGYLCAHGYTVAAPDLPDGDFDEAVDLAREAFAEETPDLVLGAGRGGAVAMNIDTEQTPLLLIAPAWKQWGLAKQLKPGTMILHAYDDEVVPLADSQELAVASGLKIGRLRVAGESHAMADAAALSQLMQLVKQAIGDAAKVSAV